VGWIRGGKKVSFGELESDLSTFKFGWPGDLES
jgi:hypothetical protein